MNAITMKKIRILNKKNNNNVLEKLDIDSGGRKEGIDIEITTKEDETKNTSIIKNNEYKTKIHYSQFPANTAITNEHVISIIGSYEKENIAEKKTTWTEQGQQLRGWAANEIRKRTQDYIQNLDLKLPDDTTAQKFEDIGKWWATCDHNEQNAIVLHHVEYGLWQNGWELQLEQAYMKRNNWEYCNKSEETVKAQCKRRNFDIKGCIGKNIANVKCQVMKNLQNYTKKHANDGAYIRKRRDREDAYQNGKYVKI